MRLDERLNTLTEKLRKEVTKENILLYKQRALGVLGEVVTEAYLSDYFQVEISENIFDSSKDMIVYQKNSNIYAKYTIECKAATLYFKDSCFKFEISQQQKMNKVSVCYILEVPLRNQVTTSLWRYDNKNLSYTSDNQFVVPLKACRDVCTITDEYFIMKCHEYSISKFLGI